MAATEYPLHWGRSDALTEISFSGVIEDFFGLVDGERREITYDHEAEDDVTFALAEPPRFEHVDGVLFILELGGTDGEQFTVIAERVDAATYPGSDYGYGGVAGDLLYSGTRRGVIE